MKVQPHFPRFATLPIATLLLVIATAALHPVSAATKPRAESDAERYVLEQVQKGENADLRNKFPVNSFPASKREVRGPFLATLLANLKTQPRGFSLGDAVITGDLDLIGQEIPYDVEIYDCTFNGVVDFTNSQFGKGLTLINTRFNDEVRFDNGSIGFDFILVDCWFSTLPASFRGMRVSRDFSIFRGTFDTRSASFQDTRVGGAFYARASFIYSKVSFSNMRVDGPFSLNECTFTNSDVSFTGAHFADVLLNGSTFDRVSIIDFTRMRADYIAFDGVIFKTPSEIKVEGMTFRLLSPVNTERLGFLLSRYNAEFYSDLETSLRTHGYPDEADKIFVSKQRAERRENCKSFLHQCDRGAWAFSLFQDALAGYGKHLENLLYWSLGFLIIGTIVFWKKDGMRLKDEKAAAQAPRYQAFWYSLDLFLPIIKLGESDIWTPNDNRRWANLYRKVHIIIGSLFVPIGLAAWTGIIK